MSTAHGEAFKEYLQLRYSNKGAITIPSSWITQHTFLKGKPYSFNKHEYQIAPVDDKHRIRAIQKCAQTGFTEIFLRFCICFLATHQGSQGIMTQPTANDMSNFAKSRVDTVFEECPIVTKLGTGGVDSVQLKRIGSSFLNLRGTFGSRAAISVPSDMNVYDEVNFSNPRVLSQYKSRLQHSEYKIEVNVSTPTIINYGVSSLFNASDQKVIMVKCQHCNEWQLLEWPKNLFFRKKGKPTIPFEPDTHEDFVRAQWEYSAYVGCKRCSREVDRSWSRREWVAKFPERAQDLENGVSGYYLSQMDAEFINALDIIKASDERTQGYKKIEDFYNFVLGLPYEGGDSCRITDTVRKNCTTMFEKVYAASGAFIGVDLGNLCHVVVIKDFFLNGSPYPTPIVIAAFTIERDELEDKLPVRMEDFGHLYTISDAQPYTTTVMKIAAANPNRMSCAYFGGKKPFSLSDENKMITLNRTYTLDAFTDELVKTRLLVADSIDDPDTFWDHCKNLIKVKTEDETTGQEEYEYVKVGPDHYGFAGAYAMAARKVWMEERPDKGGSGLAPIGITGTVIPT